ncbi:MAG: hypothetical protein OXC62_00360 [Aestuariivita sp.]|nr:hypothetical protein [Aestuariivita sp.]
MFSQGLIPTGEGGSQALIEKRADNSPHHHRRPPSVHHNKKHAVHSAGLKEEPIHFPTHTDD